VSFAATLGFEVLSHGEGKAHLRARVSAEHLNLHGGAHGGFLYSLADEAFALASNSRGAAAVALSTHIDYFQVVREGDIIEAAASEEHLGRRVATYRVELRKGDEVVGLFTGTVYRMQDKG
jgi:acyl-CoA thioesterase